MEATVYKRRIKFKSFGQFNAEKIARGFARVNFGLSLFFLF